VYLQSLNGMPANAPAVLPVGEWVFSHEVKCQKLYQNETLPMDPRQT